MTPTLTNVQKYSPAYGFEPGVVVEVVFGQNVAHFGPDKLYVFRFKGYSEYEIVILEENGGNELQPYPTEIKSIRLLSGKWAIWNFAPKGAVGCLYAENARTPVMFYKHPETFAIDKLDPDMDGDFMSPPWWWLEGRK